MSEYTKGPWISSSFNIECKPNLNYLLMNKSKAKVGELRANAQLISAAPDLLEACKDALQWWLRDTLQSDGYEGHREAWGGHRDKLKQAIQKAEGNQ